MEPAKLINATNAAVNISFNNLSVNNSKNSSFLNLNVNRTSNYNIFSFLEMDYLFQ